MAFQPKIVMLYLIISMMIVLFSVLAYVGFDKCKEETKKTFQKTWYWITITLTVLLLIGTFMTKSKFTKAMAKAKLTAATAAAKATGATTAVSK